MRNDTRLKFNAYMSQLAVLNNVDDVTKKFTVEPSVQQTLETKVQESSAFLGMVNVIGVTEQKGEKLGLGINSTIAGTTDTTLGDREPVDPTSLVGMSYECEQTNFDTALRYAKIDAWAKFHDFQTRVRDAIIKAQALDRIMIGFNGTSRAATSNRAANPLLQDVNKGWIQHVREDAPQQIMSEGVEASGKIYIYKPVNDADAKVGDYTNLDSLVFTLVNEYLPPHYQDDTELVVVLGRELLNDKYFPMNSNYSEVPSEKQALDIIVSAKQLGGLRVVRVPFFPAKSLMVTRLDNLSIYYQEGARRRAVIDNPKRDRVENYESSNDAYVVEDYDGIAIAENIEFTYRPA